MEQTKKCTKCGEVKSLSDFYSLGKNKVGHYGSCKTCYKSHVAKRYYVLRQSPEFVERERARGREKHHRLYSGLPKKASKESLIESQREYRARYPEKYKAKTASIRAQRRDGFHLHHWSYNQEHFLDVIELEMSEHMKLHRFITYDQERMMYRSLNGTLLDTKESHIEYAKSVGVEFK